MSDEERRKLAESWYRDNGCDLQQAYNYSNELSCVTHFTGDEIAKRLEAAKRAFVIGTLMEGGYGE